MQAHHIARLDRRQRELHVVVIGGRVARRWRGHDRATGEVLLVARGASRVLAYAVHGDLAADALERLCDSAIERIVLTDTIPLPTEGASSKVEVVTVAPLLAETISRIHEERSVSALFGPARRPEEALAGAV